MGKKIKQCGDTENKKHKLHQSKKSTFLYDVDINKIVVSSKFRFAKKKC